VAAVVAVGAAAVKDDVAAGSLLDHGEVLELLRKPGILKVRPSCSGPCTHNDAP
jgi:hypothetical protein